MPVLRLAAQLQLAVCGFSLAPIEMMDGAELASRPTFVGAVSTGLAFTGAFFFFGWL